MKLPTYKALHETLLKLENPIRAKHSLRFFKTGKGEYGEGDLFVGLTLPECHVLEKEYKQMSLEEIKKTLNGKFHEERLIALMILVQKYKKGSESDKKRCYELYIKNTHRINNWDLVDVTADRIIGPTLENKDKAFLYKFARSSLLWERRIAVISTFHFIKNGNPQETFKIAEILLHDKEDLIHKAVGWMLRETGKRCGQDIEEKFLKKHYKTMPRTMLRYAIENFNEVTRQSYLRGQI